MCMCTWKAIKVSVCIGVQIKPYQSCCAGMGDPWLSTCCWSSSPIIPTQHGQWSGKKGVVSWQHLWKSTIPALLLGYMTPIHFFCGFCPISYILYRGANLSKILGGGNPPPIINHVMWCIHTIWTAMSISLGEQPSQNILMGGKAPRSWLLWFYKCHKRL